MPKVSVIIPVYNGEQYINNCAKSLINQTLKNIEVIFINDGSTDKSADILNEIALKDKRIKIIHQNNQGPVIARNNGIDMASGDYIGFVDVDDFVDKKYFELLYKTAIKQNADIAATDNILMYKNKVTGIKKCGINKHQKTITSIIDKGNLIITTGITWNKIYKKSFLEKHNLRQYGFFPGDDNYFNSITIIKANKIAVTHNAKYYWNQPETSLTHKKKNEKHFKVVDNYNDLEVWVNNQTDIPIYEKFQWLYIINERRKTDLNVFLRDMEENCKEPFKKIIDKNVKCKNLIISLTSYPTRINTVHAAIESLLNQSVKADKVILWLAEEQFPNKEADLPQELLDLCNVGLEIEWCNDIKSYKKLIPTLKKYPDSYIITADDDIIYHKDCVKSLLNTYINYPNCIIANRAHYINFEHGKIKKYNDWEFEARYKKPSFNMFLTSGGTVLYFPGCFDKDIFREDLFMTLAKNTDDIWFWAMAVLNNTKIKLAEPNMSKLYYVDGTQECGLYHDNCTGGNNDNNLMLVLNYYPQILKKLNKFNKKLFIRNLFSVRNDGIRKVISVLGVKFKFKSKKLIKRQDERRCYAKIDNALKLLKSQKDVLEIVQNELNQANTKISQQQVALNQQKKSTENIKREFEYKLCKYMSPEKYPQYLKDWYKYRTGETLNLENPQTFNEKIQWMKLYDSTPIKTQLADKYLVRDWVKEKIGEEYLIPLFGVWDKFDDINFDELPEQFVLKCNHGCGYNIIVKDKTTFNKEDARKKINQWMNEDYAFRYGLEMHYSPIPRKIIAEKYIENDGGDLYDYKFWCFNGKVKYIQFLSERNTNGLKMAFYDTDWNKQDFVYSYPLDTKTIEKPNNLDEMIYLAEKLSQGFSHVRVDFYRLDNGTIYFGEMTFTSCSGICKWKPVEADVKLGQMLVELPTLKNIEEKV